MNTRQTFNELVPVTQANNLIRAGKVLVIAGEEATLQQLEKGNWIGGTIPYFMSKNGGCVDKNQVFVTDLSALITKFDIRQYAADKLESMLQDRYNHGFSYILLPAFSEVHSKYTLEIRYEPTLFDVVTMGWVTGVHLDTIGTSKPKVVNGSTGEFLDNALVAIHCLLPEHQYADIEIINIYEQEDTDAVMTFPNDSFTVSDCLIDGKPANLAQYLLDNNIDTTLPLVADHSGALVNADIQKIDKEQLSVSFFGPILSTQEYKIAKPLEHRYEVFMEKMPQDTSDVICSCNCLSYYFNLKLEGKKTGDLCSPFTFGEIAYVLLNQTMVLLSVKEK